MINDTLLCHVIKLNYFGSSIFLQSSTHNILIDLGHTNNGSSIVINYLKQLGITQLDLIVITHPHRDHTAAEGGGGLSRFLLNFSVMEIWYNGWPHPTWYDGEYPSPTTYVLTESFDGMADLLSTLFPDGFESSLDRLGYPTITGTPIIPYIEPVRGDIYEFGDMTFNVLHPYRPFPDYNVPTVDITHGGENSHSIVIQVEFKGKKLMLTGDLQSGPSGEASIRSAYSNAELKSDILYLGHHGQTGSSDSYWLDAVNPTIATAQTRSAYYPTAVMKNELKARGISFYDPNFSGDSYVFRISEDAIGVYAFTDYIKTLTNNPNKKGGGFLSMPIFTNNNFLMSGMTQIIKKPKIASLTEENLVLHLDGQDFTNDPQTTTWLDKSSYGNDGTAIDFNYTENDGSDGNSGVMFDNTSDSKVVLPDSDSLKLTKALTIFVEAKFTFKDDKNRYFIAKFDTAANKRSFGLTCNNGKIRFYISGIGTSGIYIETPLLYNDGLYHRIVAVYEPSARMALYINGSKVSESVDNIPAELFEPASSVLIGTNVYKISPLTKLNATIKTVKLFNCANPDVL